MNLRQLNLNLLVVFDAMMATRNTTKAGRQLGLSQSAISNSLTQLRGLLNDPLFVRIANEMRPTARALALAPPVREALLKVEEAVGGAKEFDPATEQCAIRIGMTDYGAFLLLDKIARSVRQQAAGIRLQVRAVTAEQIDEMLDHDEVDLCIGFGQAGDHQQSELLFRDDWVAACAPVGRPLTMEEYLSANHIVIGDKMFNHVDRLLKQAGHTRNNVISLPFCLVAPVLVEDSDMMLTLPRRLAQEFARGRRIEIKELPFKTRGFSICSILHERMAKDPRLIWLLDVISECCAEPVLAISA